MSLIFIFFIAQLSHTKRYYSKSNMQCFTFRNIKNASGKFQRLILFFRKNNLKHLMRSTRFFQFN